MGTAAAARWEWRAFGTAFGEAEARIRTCPGELRESQETYIVSNRSGANTKIRGGVLDVKLLERVDHAGLELWTPALKAPFPLAAETLRKVFAVWGLRTPEVGDRAWSLPQFLEQIVAPHPSLTTFDVHKTRFLTRVEDCLVEAADLTIDGAPITTIAVEMEDPARVWRTVRALGLAAYDNVNYVRALKGLLELHAH